MDLDVRRTDALLAFDCDHLILLCSYRPSIALAFIAEELAFQDVTEANEFLSTNAAAIYIEPTPAELAALAPQTNGKKKKSKSIPSLPLEKRQWDAKAAMQPLTDAIQKFRKVDVSAERSRWRKRPLQCD